MILIGYNKTKEATMKKIKLEENMYVYQFDAPSDGRLGTNIHVFTEGKQAFVLDAGYEQYLAEVIKDLGDVAITEILPSHYHPDHVDGIRLVDSPVVYGNQYAKDSVMSYMPEDIKILKPTKIIDETTEVIFGKFNFKFKHAPGHSNCSMLTFINGRYLHVGDLYMTQNDGTDIIPYVTWKGIEDHISSLNLVKISLQSELLLSHGFIGLKQPAIIEGLNNRLSYLNAIVESDNSCTVEEALKSTTRPFEMKKWRKDI